MILTVLLVNNFGCSSFLSRLYGRLSIQREDPFSMAKCMKKYCDILPTMRVNYEEESVKVALFGSHGTCGERER